uniref:C2H2-type domain-containing protein n=1 Tax=Steinernema glaseri TaxID=37863 RepID=A0A1I7YYZ6_9BILA
MIDHYQQRSLSKSVAARARPSRPGQRGNQGNGSTTGTTGKVRGGPTPGRAQADRRQLIIINTALLLLDATPRVRATDLVLASSFVSPFSCIYLSLLSRRLSGTVHLCVKNSPFLILSPPSSMVSTHNSKQYLAAAECLPVNPMDNSKSPLAMLAKTCETIGLPDPPAKKLSSPKSKDCSPAGSNASGDKKEDMSPNSLKSKKDVDSKSPRSTSVSDKKVFGSEPSTSMCSQFGPAFPMMSRCFPGMAAFPGATPFAMPFGYPPGPGYMAPGMAFHGAGGPMAPMAPGHHNGRPCVTPGCTSCSLAQNGAEMMMMPNLAQSFFAAAAYSNPLLAAGMTVPSSVPSSMASQLAAYQSMMEAACGQNKNVCSLPDPNGTNGHCGKSFATSDELTAHMKTHMAPHSIASNIPSSSSASTTSVNTLSTSTLPAVSRAETPKKARASPKTPSVMYSSNNAAAAAAMRFHPYMKNPAAAAAAAHMMASNSPAALNAAMASMGGAAMPHFGMPMPPFNPAALQAMYAQQRLMGTMPHP